MKMSAYIMTLDDIVVGKLYRLDCNAAPGRRVKRTDAVTKNYYGRWEIVPAGRTRRIVEEIETVLVVEKEPARPGGLGYVVVLLGEEFVEIPVYASHNSQMTGWSLVI